ncbi:MAG: radical SAM family heme chaperone HemW [Treponema sp.]|nr:radical SAM family heme chaperone HemW [Treponema sp.]
METSLYIHIPFCRKKCDYCDFYSIPSSKRKVDGKSLENDLTDSYVEAVLNEVAFYAELYGISSWKTVYVGGGTPSLLSASQLARLFSGIKEIAPFSCGYEATVEMNPDDVRDDFIAACKNFGVNRLSLGIQALDDNALGSVHRGCSAFAALKAIEYLDSSWNGRLSVDFIAGLPNQTYASFKNQFEKVFALKKIDHISLYTLTIEENTPLGKKIDSGKLDFSFERADKMWLIGRNILEKNGFMQYEVSNFSKPGFESMHNSTYWKLENYIGCGVGASGTWYGKNLDDDFACRWTNTLSVPAYVDFWNDLQDKNEDSLLRSCEIIDRKTLEFEFLMMGFRMRKGVYAEDFEKRFGKSILDFENSSCRKFADIFSEWKKNRLASTKKDSSGERYFLNRRGILLLNMFLEELL